MGADLTQEESPAGLLMSRMPTLIRAMAPARLFLAYFPLHASASAIGLASVVPGTPVTAYWPAGGLLLAACVACRRTQRPAVLAAAVCGEVAARHIHAAVSGSGPGLALELASATAHAAVCALSTVLVERWWDVPLPAGLSKLARGTAVIATVLLGGIAIAVAALAAQSDLPYLALAPTELAGHMLGALTVTPVVLSWWLSWIGYRSRTSGSRAKLAALLVAAAAAVGLVVGWPGDGALQPAYVLFPILLWAAMRFPLRHASLVGLGITAATIVLSVTADPDTRDVAAVLARLLSLQLYLCTVMISALWVGVANYERRRSEESLRRYAQAMTATDERVRRSTAADLHDGIGQELIGLGMLMRAAARRTSDGQAAEALTLAVRTLETVTGRTRYLIEELDPPWVYEMDLHRTLSWLVDRFAVRSGLRVELRIHGAPPRITVDQSALLLRCVRELLQNVVRHSGVTQATIDLRVADDTLQVAVADAGRGFDMRFEVPGQVHGGFGLFSVRERLLASGASMTIQTSPRHGCTVTILWPLDRPTGPPVPDHHTADVQFESPRA